MTERPTDQGNSPNPHKAPNPHPEDRIEFERRSFFQLISKKALAKVMLLLFLLAAIIFLQRRSASIAKGLSETLVPPHMRVSPGASERPAPTIRMAPMPDPGARRVEPGK